MSGRNEQTAPHLAGAPAEYGDHLSREDLCRLVGVAADWVYEIDAQGRFSWVSDSIRDLGVSPSMLVGFTREAVFSRIALSAEEMEDHLALVAARKPFRDFRGAFTSRDGTFRYFSTSGFPRFDADGTFTGYCGMSRDISSFVGDNAVFGELQRQLNQSRALLESVFSSLEGGVIVYDADDRLYMTNAAMRALYPDLDRAMFSPGTPLETFLGAIHDSGHVLRDDATDRESWIAERVRRYHLAFEQYDVRLANGRWIRFSNKRMEDGTFVGLRTDITALKEREAALEEALARSSLANEVLDGLDQAIFVKDETLRFVAANKAMVRTLGPDGAAFAGKMAGDLVDQDLADYFEISEREVLETGDAFETLESVQQDGETRWHTVRKNRIITADGKRYVAGFLNDVTDLKLRGEEARKANQLLQDAVDAMDQSFAIFDEDDRLMMANRAMFDAHAGAGIEIGMTFARMIETLGSFHIPEDAARKSWIERQMRLRSKALTHDGPLEVHRAEDGRWHLLDLRRTSTGAMLDIRTEITEAKERENALREARRTAELADRAKSEFLANMSHEIRTPMNGVLGMAELLDKTRLDDKQRMFTDIIMKSGNALLTIINDILDFSKIDAGQMVLDPAPFTLAEAVEDVATLMSVRAKEKDLELIVRIDPALRADYVGDAGRIRQIITNLMGNAVKFTETGHVLVNVTGEDMGSRSLLRISVSDTGIGIPPDKLQGVFDKFSQVDSSSTRRHEGTGLGLAITSRLAELMGGRVGAQSEPGKGSTFWVEIALENHGKRARTVKTPVDVTGARIVIIDDNEVNRSILMEQMKSWGFDACAARDGREGIAILKAAAGYGITVDCIVLDYQMPGMNGEQVAQAIRADSSIGGVPIILLSSVDQVLDGAINARLGISSALVKPARSSALLDAIVNAVQDCRSAPRGNGEVFVAAPSAARDPAAGDHTARQPGEARAVAQAEAVQSGGRTHRVDILVAEDNEVNQLVLTQILADTDYTFKIVTNGELAVDAWNDMAPRLVLMDVSMPQMNGLEATAHIRRAEQRDGRERTPVIGVTAHALKGDRERCLESGMDDYLSKPISPDALLRKVNEWLGQSDRPLRQAR